MTLSRGQQLTNEALNLPRQLAETPRPQPRLHPVEEVFSRSGPRHQIGKHVLKTSPLAPPEEEPRLSRKSSNSQSLFALAVGLNSVRRVKVKQVGAIKSYMGKKQRRNNYG